MFLLGVKVLFWRQMFGFKHKKIILIMSIIVPIFSILFARLNVSIIEELGSSRSGTFPEGPAFFRLPHPLTVIAVPKTLATSGLMNKASSVLQSRSVSNLELRLRFTEGREDLNRFLADSSWPSIGVEFHNVTKHRLTYTLHPVTSNISESSTGDFDDDISPYSLLLQAAIDAAYLQTNLPDLRSFSKLQNFNEDSRNRSEDAERSSTRNVLVQFVVFQLFVTPGMVVLIMMLAYFNVGDKSNGVRELLCINGLSRWMVNTSWLFTFSVLATVFSFVEMIIMKFPPTTLGKLTAPTLLVFLIVYHLTATFSVYLVSNIFINKTVTILLIIVYYFIFGPCVWFVHYLEEYFVLQTFISLLPIAGSIVFLIAAAHLKDDITVINMFSSPQDYISPGLALIMMITSIFIFLILGLYLDAVKPGRYGRARPWFLFTREEKATTDLWFEARTPSEAFVTENIKEGVPIGLQCVNIVKKFGTHKALNNVNLSIIKNNITVLLGHNGAGKTTLFSILCGMFSPTSGYVFTDEYNVFEGENVAKFRSALGYCPQENLLINELTVHEHLVVFSLLKGLVMSEAVEASEKWTEMFGMNRFRDTQSKKLSGGSKRKLCLAMALVGNPKYVLLDEPSAGLDIESITIFSNILLEERGNFTVIVTTHNMDEAEILGDRIAILAHGEVKCEGSVSYLKKMLDTGYRLNCSLIGGKGAQDVINFVDKLMPRAVVLFKTNHSVTFSLPANKTNSIPDLLQRLESRFGAKISSTLSSSTLDDVFLKVQTDEGVTITLDELPMVSQDKIRRSWWNFLELFRKSASWLKPRIPTMIFYVMLLPNLMTVLGMVFLNTISNQRPRSHSSRGAKGILALMSDSYSSNFGQPGPSWEVLRETSKNTNFTEGNATIKYLFKYRSKILFALDTKSYDLPTSFSPDESHHDVSKIYTALTSAFIQGNASIITYNSPFVREVSYECPTVLDGEDLRGILSQLLVYAFVVSFLIASSYFVLSPHNERTTVFKHLQLMTGLLPVSYWLVNLVFDMLIYIASCALTIIITVSLDRTKIFLRTDVICALILILFLYGLSSITYAYVWSFAFVSRGVAVLALLLFNTLSPIAASLVLYTVWPTIADFFIVILPYKTLEVSLRILIHWAVEKRDCGNCPSANHEFGCFRTIHNPLFELLTPTLSILAVQAIVWFTLILLFDHGMGRKLKGGIARLFCGDIRPLDKTVDREVALERQRVNDTFKNKSNDTQPQLIVDGLGKNYGCGSTAVYDVTFAAEKGECFGLVGVNGSGKTTTFGILAALLSPTKGTAFVERKWKLTDCEYNYMKRVGYCPQYDGLLRELSGRATLKLFGRLCGVPRSKINELVDKWINALNMAEIAERPCGQYSGGNKRKLSVAIALMGNAPVALLDEPTAGVDPVVRRRIWAILADRLEQKQTIILTSHTMSECEAICDRLTIMVKGVMKCLGPIPTLKKTFGKRAILAVKFTPSSTVKEQDAVESKIESAFGNDATLEDRLWTRLIYDLDMENSKMYNLFATMLRVQSEHEIVEDFNLVEAPLEQVFIMFAKKKTLQDAKALRTKKRKN